MMNYSKLNLEHLSAYLPYRLKVSNNFFPDDINIIIGLKNDTYFIENGNTYPYGDISDIKPILRPLSDLTKEITHNGETFVPIDVLKFENKAYMKDCGRYDFDIIVKYGVVLNSFPYWIIQKLLSWHFDLHNLIPNGLAISIHDLNS